MWKKMLMMLGVAGFIFGGIFAYLAFGKYMMNKYFAGMKVPPVTVATCRAGIKPWQPRVKAVGDVRALRGVEISSEVPGQVSAVRFNSGDTVKEGDILVALNAEMDLAQLKSLEASAELARTVYERDRKQLEIQAVSRALVDADAAELKSRDAAVEQQKALVSKKVIRAPFAGKLGISQVSPGRFLNPGEAIVTLQAMDRLKLDFYVPQQDMARLSLGQSVVVTVDAAPGKTFEGKISAFNSRVEKDSRNILVEATMDNPRQELLPGMFGLIEVSAGDPVDYVTIPQTSVGFNPYGETVYMVEERKSAEDGKSEFIARQTFVKTGETRGDQIAVLDGVKGGDLIVSAGQQKLKNGSIIIINNQVQPSNDAAPLPQEE